MAVPRPDAGALHHQAAEFFRALRGGGGAAREGRAGWRAFWKTVRSLRPKTIRQRFGEVRSLRTSLFDEGGHTIETPPGRTSDSEPWQLRTTIQPDGDVVWMVHISVVDDRAVLRAHAEEVRRWYADAAAAVNAFAGYATAVCVATAAGLWAVAGPAAIKVAHLWGLAASVVVPLVAAPLGRRVVIALVKARL